MIPEESPADVGRELRDLIKGAARNAAGIEVEIRRILLARPLTPLKGDERLVKRLAARASQVMGEPVSAKGVPLYTDASHYIAAGIPTELSGDGTRSIEEANAHSAHQPLPPHTLPTATERGARTAYNHPDTIEHNP